MNILFLDGLSEVFCDHIHESLRKLGTLHIFDFHEFIPFFNRKDEIIARIEELDIDIIIGNSAGGYIASHLAHMMDKPFVAMNPVLDKYSLSTSNAINLIDEDVIKNLDYFSDEPFNVENDFENGLILLEEGDTYINAYSTLNVLKSVHMVAMFKGGEHIFVNVDEANSLIDLFYANYICHIKNKDKYSIDGDDKRRN